jgi:cyclopropane-fatty-acyl-phospholipid synthase
MVEARAILFSSPEKHEGIAMKVESQQTQSIFRTSLVSQGFWRRQVLKTLAQIQVGRLQFYEHEHLLLEVGQDENEQTARVNVRSEATYRAIALGGAIGAAEAYMDGDWESPDLLLVLELFLRNRQVLEALGSGWVWLRKPMLQFQHWMNRDTEAQSKRNIAKHYDLGNAFFEKFLDETMMYSSGYFSNPEVSMGEASVKKLDLICQKLRLSKDDHVIEIGSGWGGFACHAAHKYGCKVTTTTISEAHFERTQERVEALGLQDRVTILKQDYRRLEGRFDKLVSIEMIEAVGLSYLPQFFEVCARLLKPGGEMLLQAITIAEQRFEAAKRSVDFIQRYIFPGGALASVAELTRVSAGAGPGLRVYALEDITPHYALTMARWRAMFERNLEPITALGMSDTFLRMWRYYFCYCEAGFRQRAIGCVQMQFHLPDFTFELLDSE